MKDIVERLRGLRFVHVPMASHLMEEAATEIELQRACTSAGRDEIARLQMTDEERAAIREGADALYGDGYDAEAATLRKLLERLK